MKKEWANLISVTQQGPEKSSGKRLETCRIQDGVHPLTLAMASNLLTMVSTLIARESEVCRRNTFSSRVN